MHKFLVPGHPFVQWYLIFSVEYLQFFPYSKKKNTNSYFLSKKHQITVKFTGHCRIVIPHYETSFTSNLLVPGIWR